MSTAELRFSLYRLIDRTEDTSVLNAIHAILSKVTGVKISVIHLSKAEKKAIDSALDSIKKGDVHSHEHVMKEMKKKYPQLIR